MRPPRPTASVVVPFLGSDAELQRLIERLAGLRTRPGDELIVADNRDEAEPRYGPAPGDPGQVRVEAAGGVRAPGFARNRGAARATGDWLVFIDADTHPAPDLLDAYLVPAPDASIAVLGGGIADALPEGHGPGLTARRIVARAQMSHGTTLGRSRFAYAQTANCAVRREAFVAAGGFDERIRAAEDADLCFRLVELGWRLETRPGARVRHEARATLTQALHQLAIHGAGAAWCNRRHPGSFPPPRPRQLAGRLARSAARAARKAARHDTEGAAQAALEVPEAIAFEIGRRLSNRVGP